MSAALHSGGCRCGAVRFEAAGEPLSVGYCHCGDCRRATGAPVSAFVGFRAEDVSLTGETLRIFENGAVTAASATSAARRSPISTSAWKGASIFMLGAMDRPADYRPTLHAYVREQLPFVHMPDGLPRYPKTSVPRPDGNDTMKITLSWLKDHLETDASLSEIVERLTSIGLEVEAVDDKSSLKPFVIARVLTAETPSRRRPAPGADRRYRRRPAAGAGGVRRAQRARRAGRRVRRARRLYPRHRHDARRRHDPRRREPRHDVLGARAAAVGRA